ncbi:MAG: hypothetical protein LBQ68_10655, partial [Clostridiales bacterium]|nr:hypothetical protein [Clostridiales bacterium]
MKKFKVLAAFTIVASLTLSCVYAFASVVATDTTNVPVLTEATATAEETVAATPTPAPKVYDDLAVTEKRFYNVRSVDLGTYPEVTGYDDLNATILKDLET